MKFLKKHLIHLILSLLFILGFFGFEIWDHYIPPSVQNRNQREISKIKVNPTEFSFAVFGDHKGHDAHFEPLLRDVNHDKKIAFAIELGDLVRQGRKWFFRRLLNQVEKNLSIPYLAVIGNHDLYRGSENYRDFFGPTYTSFQIGDIDFIVLDTSGRFVFDRVQRQWLETELHRSQNSKARFVFMHVPLFDPRGQLKYVKCFSEKDGKDLLNLFKRYRVTHLFASHIHGYFSGMWEGVPYTITGGAGAGLHGEVPEHFFHHYLKVHVSGDHVKIEVRRIDVENENAKNFLSFVKDYGPEWGMFAGMILSLLTLGLSLGKDQRQESRKPH